ncbi:DUF2141 domain-containing protein [Sphingomonas sp. GC_Shp_6]|uniref:DUF2141 domain-containing protein n=1 Tax=Sphingomonas sp. GC_Shp_6 TaxID=2937378 RepID=UPI002269A13E
MKALIAVAALLATAAAPAPEGTLTVRVGNVRNANGRVHVDICPEARFLKDGCPYSGAAPAVAGTTVVVVHGVAPGRYAIQAYHDENRNDKVDRNFLGLPKEGVGFSNDAKIVLFPPRAPQWADAKFDFAGPAQTTMLNLRYFIGASGPG